MKYCPELRNIDRHSWKEVRSCVQRHQSLPLAMLKGQWPCLTSGQESYLSFSSFTPCHYQLLLLSRWEPQGPEADISCPIAGGSRGRERGVEAADWPLHWPTHSVPLHPPHYIIATHQTSIREEYCSPKASLVIDFYTATSFEFTNLTKIWSRNCHTGPGPDPSGQQHSHIHWRHLWLEV